MRKIVLPLLFAGVILSSGCATYNGPKPIDPQHSNSRVSSVRPTFKWEPTNPGVTYEIAVYETFEKSAASVTGTILFGGSNWGALEVVKGERVYSKVGIATCEHTLETDLKPKTRYIWSVRETGGVWMGVNSPQERNGPFIFWTP